MMMNAVEPVRPESIRIMVGGRASGRTTALCEWVLGGEPSKNGFGWSRVIVTPAHCRAWTVKHLRRCADVSDFVVPGRAVSALADSLVVGGNLRLFAGSGPVEYAVDNAEQVLMGALGHAGLDGVPTMIVMLGTAEPAPKDKAKARRPDAGLDLAGLKLEGYNSDGAIMLGCRRCEHHELALFGEDPVLRADVPQVATELELFRAWRGHLTTCHSDDNQETEQMERSALDTVGQMQDAEDAARRVSAERAAFEQSAAFDPDWAEKAAAIQERVRRMARAETDRLARLNQVEQRASASVEPRDPGADWAAISRINLALRNILEDGDCDLGDLRPDLVRMATLEQRTRDDLKITVAVLEALPLIISAVQQIRPGGPKAVRDLAGEIGVVPAFLWRALSGSGQFTGELRKLLAWLDAAMEVTDV